MDQAQISILISTISLTGFLTATGLLIGGFKSKTHRSYWTNLGYLFFGLGATASTYTAIQTGSASDQLTTAIAWMTLASWYFWNLELIGIFTAPVVAIILLSGIFFTSHQQQPLWSIQSDALRIHIASAVLGQTFAIVACGISLIFLWLDRKLKSRRLSDLPDNFPAMGSIINALSWTLWAGFIFITIGLLSGAIYSMTGTNSLTYNLYSKIIWAILVWLWYLSILVLKTILGYRPQKVARMCLIGFLLLAASWFGILFVAPGGSP